MRAILNKMEYDEFLKNYVPELQLIEALDKLNQYSEDAALILDQLVSGSINVGNDEESGRLDPNQEA